MPCGLRLTEADYAPENAEALQWMFWQGFGHGDDREEFERDGRAPSRPRPHFDRKLSIALVDADGQYASHCCVWYLPGTDYAYVEPVCTVPGWRGKGAAKAAVYEAAGRAVALGAERAFVISDLPFYEKLGFRRSSVFRFWWKK